LELSIHNWQKKQLKNWSIFFSVGSHLRNLSLELTPPEFMTYFVNTCFSVLNYILLKYLKTVLLLYVFNDKLLYTRHGCKQTHAQRWGTESCYLTLLYLLWDSFRLRNGTSVAHDMPHENGQIITEMNTMIVIVL
jgi:hypothetical protein